MTFSKYKSATFYLFLNNKCAQTSLNFKILLCLIDKNLIDYFIPFMPMERSHVKKCAKADLEKKGHPVTGSKKNTRNWTLVSEIGH